MFHIVSLRQELPYQRNKIKTKKTNRKPYLIGGKFILHKIILLMKLLFKILVLVTITANSFAQDTTIKKKVVSIQSRAADTNLIVYDSLGTPLRYYQYSKLLRAGTHTYRITHKPGVDNRPTLIRLSAKDLEEREQRLSMFNIPKSPMLKTGMTLDTDALMGNVKKRDLENKIIILVFWSKGCYPCTGSFGEINNFIQSLPNENIALLAITSENKQTASLKLAEFPFPAAKHIFDAANILQIYKLSTYPTLVVTDNNHVIKYSASGLSTLRPFKAAVTEQLGKK